MLITEMQTLILWALLANEGGASFQKDVRPQVKKPDRDALAKEGLIIAENRGRKGYWLEATDRGWAWASEHLDAPLPKRSPAGSTVFQAWLTRLKSFMQAREVALADILGPQRLQRAPPSPAEPAPATHSNVRARVHQAYLAVTGGRSTHRYCSASFARSSRTSTATPSMKRSGRCISKRAPPSPD